MHYIKQLKSLPKSEEGRKNYYLVFDLFGNGSGHEVFVNTEVVFQFDLFVRKFTNNRNWKFEIGLQDLFNTSKEGWGIMTNGINFHKKSNTDTRSVYIKIAYNFNLPKNRYTGKSVAPSEINRLE